MLMQNISAEEIKASIINEVQYHKIYNINLTQITTTIFNKNTIFTSIFFMG